MNQKEVEETTTDSQCETVLEQVKGAVAVFIESMPLLNNLLNCILGSGILRTASKVEYEYFKSLIDEGFKRREAMKIILNDDFMTPLMGTIPDTLGQEPKEDSE